MRIFKEIAFDDWASEVSLDDEAILKAVNEMEQGLYEANLGGNIYKKRVPIGSRGKRGGARTIVAFKFHNKAFLIYGFTKNQKGNITNKEEKVLKELAKFYFGCDEHQIDKAVKLGKLIEVKL